MPRPPAPGPGVPSPVATPTLVVAPPPSGRGPHHARRSRVRWVAALLAAGLVLIGILSALPLVPSVSPAPPQTSATPAGVDTVTPSASPGSASTATRGDDLGRQVSFASGTGTGTVTVRSAVWTDTGELAPEPGRRYLVLDVTISCTGGTVGVDALMFRATSTGDRELPGFGPALSDPLGGQVLKSGATARGQVGYSLAPGAVTVEVLDANLAPVAEIRIPAP
ncbi:MAG TPA: hypothetical protein VFW55_05335 [Propionicimonas sp.]|nr:hypothetical protein [Propionicimonas sp.]